MAPQDITGSSGDGRLRIAFVYDALYPHVTGGGERRYHEVARRLATRHDVHTVSWQFWEGGPTRQADGITNHGVGPAPAFYGTDGRRTVREAAAFSRRLLGHLLANRYDVIDCSATPYVPVYAAWLAARLTRTPLTVTWHEVWGEHWGAYLADRPAVASLARRLEAGCRRLGDRAVAVSPFTARRLEALGSGPPLDVIPNGVDGAAIAAVQPADSSEVVFVGRLIADKRVDDLLRAIALRDADNRPTRCCIIGDGPERDRLEQLVGSLGLADSVTFTGWLPEDEVFSRLNAASVLAMPSIREGYGISVVEGMAAGAVPVVVRGPMTAASDLVTDGVDGLVCEPGPAALEAAISRLLDHPDGRAAMRDRARATAALHDWDRTALQLESVYRSLLGTESVPAHRSRTADGARPGHADV
jgi:glycosyltransferase involved in cell wall biosynthesis